MRPKLHAERPNHFLGIDMTKIKMAGWGWLYLSVVLDWYTRKLLDITLGYSLKPKTGLKH